MSIEDVTNKEREEIDKKSGNIIKVDAGHIHYVGEGRILMDSSVMSDYNPSNSGGVICDASKVLNGCKNTVRGLLGLSSVSKINFLVEKARGDL